MKEQPNQEKILHFVPKDARKPDGSGNTSGALLEKARLCMENRDYKTANTYAKTCLEREPDNLSAQTVYATTVINDKESEEQFDLFLKKAVTRMQRERWDVGDERFAAYLQMRGEYGNLLTEEGKYHLACRQYEAILEADPLDRQKHRYRLAPLYAILEQRERLETLLQKYPSQEESPFFQFPLAVAAFKESDYAVADRLMRSLCKRSKHWADAFRQDMFVTLTDHMDDYDKETYQPGTFDEMLAVLDCNAILLVTTPGFTDYGISLTYL